MNPWIVPALLICIAFTSSRGNAATNQYLFIGHPRDDGPGEILQRDVERVDYAQFDLLLLGGDYTWRGTGTRDTVAYLDAAFSLSSPSTLAALGNHDTQNKNYFTDVTGRPTYYAFETNGVTFVVLDTTDDGQDIEGGELQLIADTVAGLSAGDHLVIVHHHFIWLADYAPLSHLIGSPLIGASSANLSGLNFHSEVYPLLHQAQSNGVEVICLAGDRTGTDTEEFYIDHTTAEGVRFIAAGLKEELTPSLRTVVVLEHDDVAGTLTCNFQHLTDLPRIPDEALIINELHYDPPPDPGNDRAFIELYNRGTAPYDLSGASFATGVECTFPSNTIVAPGEILLVAAEPSHYTNLGIRVFDYAGTTKPDSDDPMWLRDARGLEVDYVAYGVSDPWPAAPDNHGPSLMLIDPRFDNAVATNWATSDQIAGTPGRENITPPQSTSFEVGSGQATVVWDGAVSNGWYQLECTESLNPVDWKNAGPALQATNTSIPLSDPTTAGSTNRFYRLIRHFP